MRPREQGEFHQLLCNVHHASSQVRGFHTVIVVKFRERLWYARLIGNGDHPHPASQKAEGVDRIERLRASGYFGNSQRPPLSRSHASRRQGDPVDLALHEAGDCAVLFGGDPDLPFGPVREVSEFQDLFVFFVVRDVVRWEAGGVVDAAVATEFFQQSASEQRSICVSCQRQAIPSFQANLANSKHKSLENERGRSDP